MEVTKLPSSIETPRIPPALRAARTGVQLLSKVSPRLAARACYSMMFKTRRPAMTAKLLELMSSARREQLLLRGKRVETYAWGKGPPVVLAHGWSSSTSAWTGFIQPLVDDGYTVVAFDSCGHGQSEGSEADIRDWISILRQLGERFGAFEAVIGHSLGALAAGYSIRSTISARKAVFIASPGEFDSVLTRFAETLRLPASVYAHMSKLTQSRLAEYGAEIAEISRTVSIPDADTVKRVSVLVIHDRDDREVPYAEGVLLAERWNARLLSTEKFGHGRLLKSPEVIEAVRAFVRS